MKNNTFQVGSREDTKTQRALLSQLLQPRWIFSGLFLFSLLFFLVLLRAPRIDGQLIGSDGVS